MAETSSNVTRLVVAGGSGFLGRGLIGHLTKQFDEVIVLTRGENHDAGDVRFVHWDARTIGP